MDTIELILTIAKWVVIIGGVVATLFALAFYAVYLFGGEASEARREKKIVKKAEKNTERRVEKVYEEEKKEEKAVATEINVVNNYYAPVEEKKEEKAAVEDSADLDEMLARLEAKAEAVSKAEDEKAEKEEETASAPVEEIKAEEKEEEKEESLEEIRKRALERIEARRKAMKAEEEALAAEEAKKNAEQEAKAAEEAKEAAEEAKAAAEEAKAAAEEAKEQSAKDESKEEVIVKVVNVPDAHAIDYETRLATIKENYAKIERDYNKNHNAVLKYERTQRRKIRNEKLLNKKATELTNLNLVLYNVKDLKSIDPEKKAKQEEIANHIAELKESIKTADKYIVDNATKYENAKKFDAFLEKEKQRYEIEIKELEDLIKKGNK